MPEKSACSHTLDRFAPRPKSLYPVVIAVATGEDDEGYKPAWIHHKSYASRRNGARRTWMLDARAVEIPVFFLLSNYNLSDANTHEASEERDILLIDDPKKKYWGYQGLSAKTVLMLQFVAHQCAQVKYLVKCDDDTFIHVPRLMVFVRLTRGTAAYIGKQHCGVSLFSTFENRSVFLTGIWGIPQFTHLTGLTTFPCYMQGGAYMLSGDLVRGLGSLSQTVAMQNYGGMEDMALGLWISGWNVTRFDLGQRRMFVDFDTDIHKAYKRSWLCNDRWLFVHRVLPSRFDRLYNRVCSSEGKRWAKGRSTIPDVRSLLSTSILLTVE